MGQTLSEPVTAKESAYCQNEHFRVGSSCMQGWRINMEDSHTHILSLPDDPGTAFFAVYDGHGGATVAQYAGKNLHKFILKRPEYQDDIECAMKQAFLDIDSEMLYNEARGEQMAGSTAIVVLIKNNKLFCANAGDSRAIACINGVMDTLSLDHKPNNETETRRINEGGGYVEFNRVNGNLALSRALGDFVFKRNFEKKPEEQIVTAYPDVETRQITEDWEFLVLACDGIWDVMNNIEVTEFCRKRIAMGMYPESICEELMNHCLAPDCQMGGLGGDNMTVVLVCFLHNKPYSTLVERCASSYNNIGSIGTETNTNSTSSLSSTGLAYEEEKKLPQMAALNDKNVITTTNHTTNTVNGNVNVTISKSTKITTAAATTPTTTTPTTTATIINANEHDVDNDDDVMDLK